MQLFKREDQEHTKIPEKKHEGDKDPYKGRKGNINNSTTSKTVKKGGHMPEMQRETPNTQTSSVVMPGDTNFLASH